MVKKMHMSCLSLFQASFIMKEQRRADSSDQIFALAKRDHSTTGNNWYVCNRPKLAPGTISWVVIVTMAIIRNFFDFIFFLIKYPLLSPL